MRRRNSPQFRAVPARQRLERHRFARAAFNDRLKQYVELGFQIGAPQGLFGNAVGMQLLTVASGEQAGGSGVMVFALIQRVIGKFEQLGRVICGSRVRRQAQCRANLDRHVRQFEAFVHEVTQVFAKRLQCLAVDVSLDHQRELVTAQSRYMHLVA